MQSPFISPFHGFGVFSGIRAQKDRRRTDPDPEEVQPVGIPADLDTRVRHRKPGGMLVAGLFEQGKTIVIELKSHTAQLTRKLEAAPAVTVVYGFIDPAGIMKDREV